MGRGCPLPARVSAPVCYGARTLLSRKELLRAQLQNEMGLAMLQPSHPGPRIRQSKAKHTHTQTHTHTRHTQNDPNQTSPPVAPHPNLSLLLACLGFGCKHPGPKAYLSGFLRAAQQIGHRANTHVLAHVHLLAAPAALDGIDERPRQAQLHAAVLIQTLQDRRVGNLCTEPTFARHFRASEHAFRVSEASHEFIATVAAGQRHSRPGA